MQIGVALGRQVADGVPQAERALAVAVEPIDLRRRLQDGVQNAALRSPPGNGSGSAVKETAADFREVGSDGRKRRLGRPAQEVEHAEAEPPDEGLRNEVGEAEARHDRRDGLVQRFRHVPGESRRTQRRTADAGDRDRLDVLRRDAERGGGGGSGTSVPQPGTS